MPSYALSEDDFKDGLEKLDASSIVGFKSVNKSDMIMKPDPSTFRIYHRIMILVEKMQEYFVIFMKEIEQKRLDSIEIRVE